MALRVAINGFGRIGRLVLRAIQETRCTDIHVVAINDIITSEAAVFLLKHDSVHGTLRADVQLQDPCTLRINKTSIALTAIANPEELPWKTHAVDMVFECTGRFTKRSEAARHLTAGAARVLISAPGQEMDYTTVYGVNHAGLSAHHKIVSTASCTTNCLAPVALVLHQAFGVEKGYVTTVHAYTGDQRTIDAAHKDLRRARAAAVNLIPTSTGAAKAVGLVIPALKGKLDGTAIRVPTPNVSLIEGVFLLGRSVTVADVNNAFIRAAESDLKDILALSDEPLVSSDFVHTSASATVDLLSTHVVADSLCRVMAWYDNEWGFACRMLDVARAWTSCEKSS
ncbi:MAG: type I glyceraldehyde-3-phosphate dehydrogenase [Holosporales bacterium]|jgi:glyceraldehyde 3-phosphate dehydrogenase|nr:type I glyceraldehyde-3-phosphate dehydrogenase [Holosporales bacterium]